MRIDHPAPHRIPALWQLWQEAFGDVDAFLDTFFSVAYAPERCRCVMAETGAEAALYWFDVTCRNQKFAYIYAIATTKASRGQGFCRALMADTAEVLKNAGYCGALLVPQDEGLRAMYGRMGYLPAGSIEEFFCAAGDTTLPCREISPEEYAALRPGFAPEGSAVLEETGLNFLATLARFYSGSGFLATVSREQEHLRILEYLGDQALIPALIATLGRTEATVRTPGTGMPFAMYLPLTPDCHQPGYYPFAFD